MLNQSFDRQIENAEKAGRGKGIRELTQISESSPEFALAIAVENLKKDLMAAERQDDMDNRPTEVPPDVIGRNEQELMNMLSGAPQQPQPQPQPQPQLQQQEQGLPQIPANNMAMPMAAQGGIVGYANGGDVPDVSSRTGMTGLTDRVGGGGVQPIPALMDKYGSEMVMEFLEGEKRLREEGKHVAPEYADAYQQTKDNFYSRFPREFIEELYTTRSGPPMAGGGIVSLQSGGNVKSFQLGGTVGPTYPPSPELDVATGQYRFYVPDAGGEIIEVDEETYNQVADLYDQRNRRDFPESFEPTPVGDLTPEQIYQKRVDQSRGIIGPLIFGERGVLQDQRDVAADPNLPSWQQQAGGMAEVSAEAVLKFLATLASSVGIGGEYVARSGAEMVKGAAKTGALGEAVEGVQTLTSPSQRQQLEDAFNAQMAALSAQLNELRNTPINFDIDPNGEQRAAAMAALQDQRDQLKAQYELTVSNLSPDMEILREVPQNIGSWMENYLQDPESTWLGRRAADIFGEARTAPQPPPEEDAPDPVTGAQMLGDHDLYLQAMEAQGAAAQDKKLAAFMGWLNQSGGGAGAGGGTGDGDRDPPPPPPEEGKTDWVQLAIDMGRLLGGGAGASKGHEFSAITEAAAQRRAVEDAQEFDMAKQEALLNQRTEEYEARAEQMRALAKAEAVLEQRPHLILDIQNDPRRGELERKLMDDPAINRGFLLPRDQDAIDVALAEWDAEQLKIRMRALGEIFNEQTQLFEGAPAGTTTVTEGFGEEVTTTPTRT